MSDPSVAPAERSLVTTRVLRASRASVYAAWTDPARLALWYPPDRFTARCALELRPGGPVRVDMIGPDGTVYPAVGAVREVVPNERFVFTLEGENSGVPPEVLTTVSLADRDGGTELAVTETTATAELFAGIRDNMALGLAQSIDKLAALLGDPDGTTTMVADRTLMLTRTFATSRPALFAVLTEPAHLTRWMFADAWESHVAETDLRPGGRFRIGMRPADRSHEGFAFEGTYREVAPPEHIVQVIGDGRVMAWMLEDRGGATRLRLSVEMAFSAEQERAGYSQILEHLAQHLATLRG